MVCRHLEPIEKTLQALHVEETFRGDAWSKNCREWVYFRCILDLEKARRAFEMDPCVENHDLVDARLGSELGLYCRNCHDGVMGLNPKGSLDGVPFNAFDRVEDHPWVKTPRADAKAPEPGHGPDTAVLIMEYALSFALGAIPGIGIGVVIGYFWPHIAAAGQLTGPLPSELSPQTIARGLTLRIAIGALLGAVAGFASMLTLLRCLSDDDR